MVQSFRYWNLSLFGDRPLLHIVIWHDGEYTVRVNYVPLEQIVLNDSSHRHLFYYCLK